MRSYSITLSEADLELAVATGTERNKRSLDYGLQPGHGFRGNDLEVNILGAAGEIACCRWLNLEFVPTIDTFKAPDIVGTNIQVRTTKIRDRYCLIVRKKDRDDEIFVQMAGSITTREFFINGWIYGADAKNEEWMQTYNNRPGAYFVPQYELNDPLDLRRHLLKTHQHVHAAIPPHSSGTEVPRRSVVNTDAVAGGNGKDEGQDAMYQAFLNAKPAEAKFDDEPVPPGTYLVEFKGGKGSFGSPKAEEKIPQVRLPFTVIEGQDGTVGLNGFSNLKLDESAFEYVEKGGERVRTPLTKDQQNANRAELAARLQRVAAELQLQVPFPARPYTDETLTEYGKQFAGRKAVVIVGILPGRDGGEARNWIKWQSICSLSTRVVIAGRDLGTAVEYVRAKIKAANVRLAKKTAGIAAAAATTTAPAATAQDFE